MLMEWFKFLVKCTNSFSTNIFIPFEIWYFVNAISKVLEYAPCKTKVSTGVCQLYQMAGVKFMGGESAFPTNNYEVR